MLVVMGGVYICGSRPAIVRRHPSFPPSSNFFLRSSRPGPQPPFYPTVASAFLSSSRGAGLRSFIAKMLSHYLYTLSLLATFLAIAHAAPTSHNSILKRQDGPFTGPNKVTTHNVIAVCAHFLL